jgi:hypothetical protein
VSVGDSPVPLADEAALAKRHGDQDGAGGDQAGGSPCPAPDGPARSRRSSRVIWVALHGWGTAGKVGGRAPRVGRQPRARVGR